MKTKQNQRYRLMQLILTALFAALVVVMTVTPQTGYFSYGGVIEITTLHVVVILGACCLDFWHSAVLGGVWGITCILRAMAFIEIPGMKVFTNPLVSLVPRILVGVVAWAVFKGLTKTKMPKYLAAVITAIAGTLTNTVLVISMLAVFTPDTDSFLAVLKNIILTVASLNGGIELVLGIIVIPPMMLAVRKALEKSKR